VGIHNESPTGGTPIDVDFEFAPALVGQLTGKKFDQHVFIETWHEYALVRYTVSYGRTAVG